MTTREVTCPSGLVVRVSNLKVRQIKQLSDREGVRSGRVFQTMLQELATDVLEPGPYDPGPGTFDWRKALQGDRLVALVGIRCATHGSSFDFDVECGRCQADKPIQATVDLLEMPVIPYPEETIADFRAGKPAHATIGGRRVEWAHMTGAEEKRVQDGIARLTESSKARRKAVKSDPLTDSLIVRLKVDGVGPRELPAWLDDLDGAELAKLNTAMQDQLGGLDTTIRVRHDTMDCRGVTAVELPFFAMDFWLPKTATQEPATTTEGPAENLAKPPAKLGATG
jgi:hypothetical protein